jgi:plastocyanin
MKFGRWFMVGMFAVACGGDSGTGGGSNTCTPGSTAAIAFTATGLSPQNACVLPNGTVTFTNNDTAAHSVVFDTQGCPTVGDIAPGGGHVNATFPTQANCTFHDGANATNTAFRGTVAVAASVQTGGGY